MGKLYLWHRDGSILTFAWDRLAESVSSDPYTALALECAFRRSDFLYATPLAVFKDVDFSKLLREKFRKASARTYQVSAKALRDSLIAQQDNPFPFPHTDTTIYKQVVHVSSRQGVHAATCGRKTKYPISTKPRKLWDGYAMGISTSWWATAIAAGGDGLFELSSYEEDPLQLHTAHASTCNWNYWSVYATSSVSGGYLADYIQRPQYDVASNYEWNIFDLEDSDNAEHLMHKLDAPHKGKIITADKIFGTGTSLSWGAVDKICSATETSIEIKKYNIKTPQERTTPLGSIDEPALHRLGAPISARTAAFGMVLEFQDEIVVLDSLLERHRIPGAPVNWRVFPRSRRYENHLHVVGEDCISIMSFNSDYFTNQASKISGVSIGREQNSFTLRS